MNELKPCPFCGGAAKSSAIEDAGVFFFGGCEGHVTGKCTVIPSTGWCDTQAEAIAAWNTRAAPTMKAWEWSEGDGASVVWCCLDFKAFVYSDCGMWRAYVDCRSVGSFATLEAGKDACVAYVDGKLKEWLS